MKKRTSRKGKNAFGPWTVLVLLCAPSGHEATAQSLPSAWPQPYSVRMERSAHTLTLSTPYYTFQHDLNRGAAISLIRLTNGKATNLLLTPMETRVRDGSGRVFSDLNAPNPRMTHSRDGLTEVVVVDSGMADREARAAQGLRLKTRYEYHWGYVRIRKGFVLRGKSVEVQELSPFTVTLAPGLAHYGYREGTTEQEGAPAFSFGSCRWGKLRADEPGDKEVSAVHLPRYLMLADPGVEGLEWFVASDLSQWDLQLTGRRGQGRFALERSKGPAGLALSISPYQNQAPLLLTNSCAFDYYVGVPILEGTARPPWFHASFNRNKGDWVGTDQVRRWAESGIQTVHCHNDGDYYDDGLFWRDGSYPPYPDMESYDKVIRECHDAGIRVATYFSNKELHPSTAEYQAHGPEWGRKSLKGGLQHNYFRGTNEFGVQMCLRSGWLQFLESSIDRVLTRHALDGVYYDWNVALVCCNELHGAKGDAGAATHWDIDELLKLMEWTRRRVGPNGLVIVHNTTTPMFATENFANNVVANEWGYGKWTGGGPELKDLPTEWSLVGARSRGVISYGQLDSASPRRLHQVFALEALVSGVTPWPASSETFQIFPVLKPITDIGSYRFADWQNDAVKVQGKRCASAIYSRPGECCILLANLHETEQEVQCRLDPRKLPFPIISPSSAMLLGETVVNLDPAALVQGGVPIRLPADSAILLRVR